MHLLQQSQVWHSVVTPTHTHTHPFNGPLSGTTRVSQYQKGKTSLDFTEARDSEWQWHQLGRMQICTSLQTDNHASTPTTQFFTGRMPFLRPTNSVKALKAQCSHSCCLHNFILFILLLVQPVFLVVVFVMSQPFDSSVV